MSTESLVTATHPAAPAAPLRVLVVDDEALARLRLRTLLEACRAPSVRVLGEAANAADVLARVQHEVVDVLLLDIHMPGADGLTLARSLRSLPQPPAVVFVTAHLEHAVQAFDLEAVDYLTKPVRLERLQVALDKAARWLGRAAQSIPHAGSDDVLILQDRGRTERLPLAEVLYFKAELKYLTVRTAQRSWLRDGALNELEARYGDRFLRIHRNALVARHAIRALEKHHDPDEGDGWAVCLNAVPERLMVSRRQLAAVRLAITGA
jgi:two-component system response regulator AlgR